MSLEKQLLHDNFDTELPVEWKECMICQKENRERGMFYCNSCHKGCHPSCIPPKWAWTNDPRYLSWICLLCDKNENEGLKTEIRIKNKESLAFNQTQENCWVVSRNNSVYYAI